MGHGLGGHVVSDAMALAWHCLQIVGTEGEPRVGVQGGEDYLNAEGGSRKEPQWQEWKHWGGEESSWPMRG